jgi:hypothetical protein
LADNPLSDRQSFMWGCLGAILPEVLRLYTIATHQQNYPHFSWPYIIISIIFMLSAGGLTVAWKPENSFKAIWIGISFPTLVSTLAKVAPNLPSNP